MTVKYDPAKCFALATDIATLSCGDFRFFWAWLASAAEAVAKLVLDHGAQDYYLSMVENQMPAYATLPDDCHGIAGRFIALSSWEQQQVLYLLIPYVEVSASQAFMTASRLARKMEPL